MSQKPTNPKDAIGGGKLPLHLWPSTATMMGCIGLLNGMLKYGRLNWRPTGVRASIYIDACKRHLDAWFEGEEYDEDGVPNLGASLACIAIIVDAQATGVLNDDRQFPGGYRKMRDELTPIVDHLKRKHAGKDPHHYTIQDDVEQVEETSEAEPPDPFEDILRKVTTEPQPAFPGSTTPIWQEPHTPSWPFGGGVISNTNVTLEHPMDEDEISEMCRLAKSETVVIGLHSLDEEEKQHLA